jgi:hypothetical protein
MKANIDTDVIIPAKRLVGHRRDELGAFAFEAYRYRPDRTDTRISFSISPDIATRRYWSRARTSAATPRASRRSGRSPASVSAA